MNTEDYNRFKQTIKNFIQSTLLPAEKYLDDFEYCNEQIMNDMKKLGLFGITIPTEYGGMGLTIEQEIDLMLVLGKVSPVFQAQFGTNQGIGSYLITNYGSLEQKEKYFPEMAKGDIISSFAATEINAGSDIRSVESMVTKDGNKFILNGSKRYISNAPIAGIFIVLAKIASDSEANSTKHGLFIVEKSNLGLTISDVNKQMGHKGATTANLTFKNCILHEGSILGELGNGLELCYQNLNKGRLIIAAMATAAAERLLEDSIQHAKKRKQFGKKIGEFQLIQGMLADMYTEIMASKSMVLNLAKNFSTSIDKLKDFSCCKYFASEMVNRIADKALQIHGGEGYMKGNIERFYRDVRLFRIYEGTSQIQQLIIAKQLLKE